MNLKITLLLTLVVRVSTANGTFTSKQICHNCGVGPDCGPSINETQGVSRESLWWTLCDAVENCTLATLDSSSICKLYNCMQISQSIGGHTYRRTNFTDCPEYEIFVHKDYSVNCAPIEQHTTEVGEESCLESCLETQMCRGSVYNASSSNCSYYDRSCTTLIPSPGDTFIQRKCADELLACVRNNTQTCINCRAGLLCKMTYNQAVHTKPLQINTTLIGVDQDLEQIWFSPTTASGSSYMYMQCSYVTQSIGDIVYRASCSQDCLKFELFTLIGYKGTCDSLGELTGGVTLEFCMDKCLNMDQCRGVTYDASSQNCTFHNCDNYTAAVGIHFMRRRCIDEPECQPNETVIQTCIHCQLGPNCPDAFMNNITIKENAECYNIKASDQGSLLVHYKRSSSQCISYQCSQVQQNMGDFVYRQSCNTDCPDFELFQLEQHEGTCDVIGTDEGGLNFEYCIERCLDIHGCRATTFDSSESRCQYHSCTSYNDSTANMYFMWKRCGPYDCPIYRLFKLIGYVGSGVAIGYEEGNLSLPYCIDKCLDLAGCRAVSFNTFKKYCYFHNSTERSENPSFRFVKRICLTPAELDPAKLYTQICKNCKNSCYAALSVENNKYMSSACNTTCDECNSIQYNPILNSCSQYQCDRPFPFGEGTTLMRRTANPDEISQKSLKGNSGNFKVYTIAKIYKFSPISERILKIGL